LPHCVRVEIPADAESMLLSSTPGVANWRRRVRRGLQWSFAAGYTISAFALPEGDGSGYYLLTKQPTTRLSSQTVR
jgi:predicted GNAT superfamily acetyltransferase